MEDTRLRLDTIMETLKGKHSIESHQTDELFALHNIYFPNNMEYGKTCSTCRARVYKRMKKLWVDLNTDITPI